MLDISTQLQAIEEIDTGLGDKVVLKLQKIKGIGKALEQCDEFTLIPQSPKLFDLRIKVNQAYYSVPIFKFSKHWFVAQPTEGIDLDTLDFDNDLGF